MEQRLEGGEEGVSVIFTGRVGQAALQCVGMSTNDKEACIREWSG